MSRLESFAKLKLVRAITSLRVTVVCLSCLIVIVFWGTIYQTEYGLYAAQRRFFYSWTFLAFGFLPFPGARLVMWVFFISLLGATILKLKYRWSNIGILMTHIGVLSFFLSAFVTFHFSQHSSLRLFEGGHANVSSDYNEWELSIWQARALDDSTVQRDVVALAGLQQGRAWSLSDIGCRVEVETYYDHCRADLGPLTADAPLNAAGITRLTKQPRNTSPEEDVPGGIFRITPTGDESQRVLLYGAEPAPLTLEIGDESYRMALRRKRYELPFSMRLLDFERKVHSGTALPKSFKSRVEVRHADSTREVVIWMNHPLRHENFTFFQSSFTPDELGSIFAVVENPGRWFPYIASLITCLGLIVHFVVMLVKSRRRQRGMA